MKRWSTISILIVIHLVIVIPLVWYLNIWSDEASTLHTTGSGIAQALTDTVRFEKQAPFYFIVLAIWREIDSSIFFARLFSVIFSVASIPLLYGLVKRFWDAKTAQFAAFFFSFHPFLIWTATEIRVYTFVIFLSILLFYLFEKAFLAVPDESSKRQRIVFFAVAIVSLCTNFYLGFILAAFFAGLIVLRKWQEAKSYFVYMAVAGLLILPVVWVTIFGITTSMDGHKLPSTSGEGLRLIWNHVLSFVLPTELFPPEDQTYISFVRLWIVRILAILAMAGLLLRRKLPDSRFLFLAAVNFVVCAFLLFAYFALNKLYVELRHASVLFVPVFLLLIALIRELMPAGRQRVLYLGFLFVLGTIFYSYGLTALYPTFTKRGDWQRVNEYIQKNEKPGQAIVVFRNYEVLALAEYYTGPNKIYPNDRYFYWNYEGEIGTNEMWPKQIDYVISTIPNEAKEVWLVTEEICHTTDACLSLENYVKENYTVVDQKEFFRERVRHLRRR